MSKKIKLNQLLQEVIKEATEKYKNPVINEQEDPKYTEMKKAIFESLSKIMDEERGRKPSPAFTGMNQNQYNEIGSSLHKLLKIKGSDIAQNASDAGMLSEFGKQHFQQYITNQLGSFTEPLLKAMIEFMYSYEKPYSSL
jgi:hypothetical protein